jgi:hypothetical protein
VWLEADQLIIWEVLFYLHMTNVEFVNARNSIRKFVKFLLENSEKLG